MPKLSGSTPSLRIVTPPSSKNEHAGRLAFAQTMAAGQAEALGVQIAHALANPPAEVTPAPEEEITVAMVPGQAAALAAVPPPEVSTLEPIIVPDIESIRIEVESTPMEVASMPIATTPIEVASSPTQPLYVPETTTQDDSLDNWRPSLIGRLRSPTRWRSKTWIATWVILTGTLALLVLKPPPKRNETATSPKVDAKSALAARPVEATPPAPVDTARPVQALAPLPAPTSAPAVPAAAPASMGYLTVHSTSPYAGVYLGSRKYGRIDQKLLVRCGERFVAIGLPRHGNGREPIWLAPGKTIDVPCGGSLDMKMNPRRLRPKKQHQDNRHGVPNRPHR
jgi:hypothetical protein